VVDAPTAQGDQRRLWNVVETLTGPTSQLQGYQMVPSVIRDSWKDGKQKCKP
jgi:hypothetical protein